MFSKLKRLKDLGDSESRLRASKVCRADDLAARYGGEEFALILPDMNSDEALGFAKVLKAALETAAIPHPRGIDKRVTASMGLATVGADDVDSVDTLVRHADAALYDAKREGRDRIAVWSAE